MSFQTAPAFEALIVPYRSITPKRAIVLVLAIALLSALLSLRFWLLGAWPVVVFSLFEVPLMIVLFTINLRRARASELIMLTAEEFTVVRTDPAGRRKQVSLPSAWLHINLDNGRQGPRVLLSSHGRACEIGAFLHEPDKLSLFDALSEALYRTRNPRFDNFQLNDN